MFLRTNLYINTCYIGIYSTKATHSIFMNMPSTRKIYHVLLPTWFMSTESTAHFIYCKLPLVICESTFMGKCKLIFNRLRWLLTFHDVSNKYSLRWSTVISKTRSRKYSPSIRLNIWLAIIKIFLPRENVKILTDISFRIFKSFEHEFRLETLGHNMMNRGDILLSRFTSKSDCLD